MISFALTLCLDCSKYWARHWFLYQCSCCLLVTAVKLRYQSVIPYYSKAYPSATFLDSKHSMLAVY